MGVSKYVIITKRHAVGILAVLFLVAVVLIVAAAVIPYMYAMAQANSAAARRSPVCGTDRAGGEVSITFDVSQGGEHTGDILAVLAGHKARATFFVTGKWAQQSPGLVQAILEAGHEIMSGGDDAIDLTQLTAAEQRAAILAGGDQIRALTASPPSLFRAPAGGYDAALLDTLDGLGLTAIGWDVDARDDKTPTADAIVQNVVTQASSGSIVRFGTLSRGTLDALPDILSLLEAKGCRFVPATEMLYSGAFTLDQDGRQIATES